MPAPGVVVLQPFWQDLGALVVCEKWALVRPFDLQGAIEALDFAVLPGAMRADQHLARAQALERELEIVRAPIAKRVVAHHPPDAGDAAAGKEGRGAVHKPRTGRTGLIGVDLGIGVWISSPGVSRS